MQEVRSRRFPVRGQGAPSTDEKDHAGRSATSKAMETDPFSLIASAGGNKDDIPS